MPQKANDEIELCRAALADQTSSLPKRNYARGYLALHDAAWLGAFDFDSGEPAGSKPERAT